MGSTHVLEVEGLRKTYRIGFWRKPIPAAQGISFSVREGEIFGLLGSNGVGKTTTLKAILSLIRPDAGAIRIFGQSHQKRSVLRQVGYLPENPYVYQYLRADEFLELSARLTKVPGDERKPRIDEMLRMVGLSHASDRPIGKFSKGMMQRVGLAQALLHKPKLLILDEPMSGLDPAGRREVRELIEAQRAAGNTVLFTSHILHDVEQLCDRVAVLRKGVVAAHGTIAELQQTKTRKFEIVLQAADEETWENLSSFGSLSKGHGLLRLEVDGQDALQAATATALTNKAQLISVGPIKESLEHLFVEGGAKE